MGWIPVRSKNHQVFVEISENLRLFCSVILSHLDQLDRYGVDVMSTSQLLENCSYIRKKV